MRKVAVTTVAGTLTFEGAAGIMRELSAVMRCGCAVALENLHPDDVADMCDTDYLLRCFGHALSECVRADGGAP